MEYHILIRRSILLQLEAASPATLPVPTILCGLRLSGFDMDEKNLLAHLDYLEQKNMLKKIHSPISAAHIRVKLSADGRDYLESGDF